jgi:hypothetical protein
VLAVDGFYVATAGAVLVHRLPHTTSVGLRSRNRQSHRDKRADKQQHKQHSGGQAIHDWKRTSRPLRIGEEGLARKHLQVTVVLSSRAPPRAALAQ